MRDFSRVSTLTYHRVSCREVLKLAGVSQTNSVVVVQRSYMDLVEEAKGAEYVIGVVQGFA